VGDIAIGGEIGLASGWPHPPHETLADLPSRSGLSACSNALLP
jgi:hypothetical protein